MIRAKKLIGTGSHCTDTAKANQAEPPTENQPVLELSGEHIAIQIPTSGVPAKFVIRTIDAIAVERRFATCAAPIQVVGEHLLVVKAEVFVEGDFVGLKGILAAEV